MVAAIQSVRGVVLMSAVTLVAEIGDFGRFTSPQQLMAWLGLVPKAYSSGRKVARGTSPRLVTSGLADFDRRRANRALARLGTPTTEAAP